LVLICSLAFINRVITDGSYRHW